jgi:hypothetical protein
MPVQEVLPSNLDLSSFKGQWVVICNKKIIAHAKNLNKIKKEIESCPRTPTIAKVPEEGTLIF